MKIIRAASAGTQESSDAYVEIEPAKEQGKGAIALRGKMIDASIVARTKRNIAMAEALGLDREGLV